MALMTGKEYVESLRKLNMKVYMFGKKVENPVDDPILAPSVNSVKMTYDLAQGPNYADLMTATSHLTGETVNRFMNIHQSTDDLVKKVKMQRLLGQVTAACFQRCVGMDAINAVYSTTYEIDQKYGTQYHENFKKFVIEAQRKDWTIDGAMTDPKGDRGLPPHKQEDPDMFLHVVEQRPDGIVVRGAKAHQTGMCNSHQVLVMPTQAMGPEDKEYAVSFSCPADAEGLFMIVGRQSCDTRKLEGSDIDVGNAQYGGVELLVVFDDVFIPNENIYMNGESEFATVMVERFAGYHRQSYGGCKVGVGDVLIGAAAVAADYEMARIAEDLAGGAVGTCLSEADLHGEFTGPWVEKYMKNGTGTTAENRMRILRLIENLSLGAGAVGYRTESLHGAGSPQAQRVMIARQGDIAGKKVLAKRIARVKED